MMRTDVDDHKIKPQNMIKRAENGIRWLYSFLSESYISFPLHRVILKREKHYIVITERIHVSHRISAKIDDTARKLLVRSFENYNPI